MDGMTLTRQIVICFIVALLIMFARCNIAPDFVYFDFYEIGNKLPTGSFKIYPDGQCYYFICYRTDGSRHPFVIDDVIKPDNWKLNGGLLTLNGDRYTILKKTIDTILVKSNDGRCYGLYKSPNQI